MTVGGSLDLHAERLVGGPAVVQTEGELLLRVLAHCRSEVEAAL